MKCSSKVKIRPVRSIAGVSLVETIIFTGVAAILIAVALSFAVFAAKNYTAMVNYVDLDSASRSALDRLTRDLRQAKFVVRLSDDEAVIMGQDDLSIQYQYDSAAKKLVRVNGQVSETMLTECQQLKFVGYQRNPIGGTYDQYPLSTGSNVMSTCKLIQVSWKCSRSIIGVALNTESVQTAKIVLRQQ